MYLNTVKNTTLDLHRRFKGAGSPLSFARISTLSENEVKQ